jgi:putative chitinase
VTPAQLAALAPNCDAATIAPLLSAAAAEFEINTPLRLSHWISQLSVESGGFLRTTENLNYSAERLMVVWPSRFQTLAAAEACAHNPDALALRVYSGRAGNVTGDDAVRFIGRGWTQLTGRSNYRKYGAKLGLDLIGNPKQAADPGPASRIAGAYWADHGLNVLADEDNIEAITRAINGGLTNLAERTAALAKAKLILGA